MALIPLGGLWKSRTKKGEEMLSGDLGRGARLVILPNNRKSADNQPDFVMYVGEKESRDSGGSDPGGPGGPPPPGDPIPY